jgi:DUF1707 SHOCT-like domain
VRPEPGAHARASHADRERVIDLLKAAFVQERLTRDEFGTRVGQALTSRTYAELATVVADLPAELILTVPLHREPARPRGRVSMNTAVTGGACMVVVANVGMALALLTGNPAAVVLVIALIVIGAIVAIGAMIGAP